MASRRPTGEAGGAGDLSNQGSILGRSASGCPIRVGVQGRPHPESWSRVDVGFVE